MGKKVIGTCDFPGCAVTGDVQPASIMLGNKDWDGDLCREHQEPFLLLIRPNRKKTDRERVWTMEEIEDLRGGS